MALTRPRLLRFALHFAILSLNIELNLTLGPNKGVEEDREGPVLISNMEQKWTSAIRQVYVFSEPGGF